MTIETESKERILEEVKSLILKYFELIYTNDLDLFGRVFDKKAQLYTLSKGETLVRTADAYRKILSERTPPKEQGAREENEVFQIDLASETQAFAKVKVRINDNVFIDYLTLLRLDGGWRIASKTYHRVTSAAA
jgi:Putative lumazine-binding